MSDPLPLPPSVVRRRRVQLIALAVLFLGPLALAALVYYGSSIRPPGRVARGELVDPPRRLPASRLRRADGTTTAPDFLRRQWSLLVVTGGDCDARCGAALATTLAARTALAAEAGRVQRVLLAAPPCCDAASAGAQPGLVTAWLDSPDGERLGAALAARSAPEPGRIYLVDPLGNLMMSYAPGADPKDLVRDLGRLLRLSQIG